MNSMKIRFEAIENKSEKQNKDIITMSNTFANKLNQSTETVEKLEAQIKVGNEPIQNLKSSLEKF